MHEPKLRQFFYALMAVLGIMFADAAVAGDPPGHGSCSRQYPTGMHTLYVTSGGLQRTVLVYVPTSYDGRRRLPLVLDLHGSGSTAAEQLDRSQLALAAEKHAFIAAAPQGVLDAGPGVFRWNVPGVTATPPNPPDDERFLSDTIDTLEATLCIDHKEVYADGYSGGGRMISQYACDHPERLAAIALISGLRAGVPRQGPNGPEPDPGTCNPSRPVPIISFQGTADPVNPYLGGGNPYWQYGVPAAQARWAELNDCHQGPRTRPVTEHVSLIAYFACEGNARVLMYLVEGGGHTWPGSKAFLSLPALGPVTFEIDATDLLWDFFEKHRLPGRQAHEAKTHPL